MYQRFKPTRLLFTSFYVASLISFNIFRLIPGLLETWTTWVLSLLVELVPAQNLSSYVEWWALILVCVTITFLIRNYVIEPLGFYVNGNATNGQELIGLGFLVMGFYIYSFNQFFPSYIMPQTFEFFNILFGESSPVTNDIVVSNTWSIIPWIWYLGPVAYMYYIFVKSEFHYARRAREERRD